MSKNNANHHATVPAVHQTKHQSDHQINKQPDQQGSQYSGDQNSKQNRQAPQTQTSLLLMSFTALGVVFGDLGTSPLYAMQDAFSAQHALTLNATNIVGLVSLFVWTIILVVCLKYVTLLMRADHEGEGGILALLARLRGPQRSAYFSRNGRYLVYLALIGMVMLYGDGVITPAISVLSAVEGLELATPALGQYVVSITVIILVGLFAIQPFGSGKVGSAFAPILLLWFISLLLLGIHSIVQTPSILQALNPWYAVQFFAQNGFIGFTALGAVILCITGAEALYADMGHFGRKAITWAWYVLACPALIVNYLGQGALLLRNPAAASRPFYNLVPEWAFYPMIILATLATVIASQALISAVFSLTRQATHLGLFPHMSTRHTSSKIRGQVYISGLNWLMMLMTIAIVLAFQSSEHLAAAYGLAVAVTMTTTTILFAVFARQCWHWSLLKISCIAGFFLIIDFAFLAANTLKFFAGGWLPFAIGGLVFLVAVCWFNGRRVLLRSRRELSISTDDFMQSLEAQALPRVQGTAVFLTEHYYRVPNALQHHLRHNQVLHDNMVILVLHKVNTAKLPSQHQRLSIETLDCGFVRIVLRVGYMEDPNVPSALQQAEQQLGQDFFSLDHTSFYLGREALVVAKTSLWRKLWLSVFLWLHKNEHDASSYFKLPPNRVIEMGTRIALR